MLVIENKSICGKWKRCAFKEYNICINALALENMRPVICILACHGICNERTCKFSHAHLILEAKNQLFFGAYQPLETWQKIDSTLMLVRRICEAFSDQVFLSWEPMVKVSSVQWLRDGFLRKRMHSFWHCPNYLPPFPPIRKTCTIFFRRRNSIFESKFRTKNNLCTI